MLVEVVALHVSAWIETDSSGDDGDSSDVALHVSAWIETACAEGLEDLITGRAPRERVD